jgi:K+-transporting ATPase ATPase C chain
MKFFAEQLKPALILTGALLVLLCGVYPLTVWGLSQVIFPHKANGSLVYDENGVVIGSELIGQPFTAEIYFHPRPSAAGAGYDGTSSGGSNLGPLSQKLNDLVVERIREYRADNSLSPTAVVPADAVMASASGLDPHISIENAQMQAPRIAQARSLPLSKVLELIKDKTDGKSFGILGEPGVNVLLLNLALDELR